jgi:hypothetical protein
MPDELLERELDERDELDDDDRLESELEDDDRLDELDDELVPGTASGNSPGAASGN